jgi:hypothetical protein
MGKRSFTNAERYAVYTVHGERCYLCSKPIDLVTMEVDHIIPESLLKDPIGLAKVLRDFGLSEDFDVQSPSNWLPACRPCNNKKRSHILKPSPILQRELERAAARAGDVGRLSREVVRRQQVTVALSILQRAADDGQLEESGEAAIRALVGFHVGQRESDAVGKPMLLTPLLTVFQTGAGIELVKGPYGVGARPSSSDVPDSMHCPSCGCVG